MRKLVLVIVGVVGLAIVVPSGFAAEATVGADVVSAYVWRGITFNDSMVVQPSVDVTHPSGLNFNVWGNYDAQAGDVDGDGVDDVASDDFQEIDLTVSYALPVEVMDVSVGVIDYTFPAGGSSTTEAFVSTSKGIGDILSLGLDAYYDFDEVEDYYLSFGLGLALPITDELSLDLAGTIGYAGKDMAAGGMEGFHDYNISVSTSVPIGAGFDLSAFLAYAGSADTDVLPEQEVDLYGGIGIYHSF